MSGSVDPVGHYIDLAYAGEPPDPWTYEHEAELPEPFQRSDL